MTVFQHLKESAQQFLIRALDLPQGRDLEVCYDESLIQKTFMKSFKTWLHDDILAANLRPIFRDPTLTGEDLMRQVKELKLYQEETQQIVNRKTVFESKLMRYQGDDSVSNKKVDESKQILAEI